MHVQVMSVWALVRLRVTGRSAVFVTLGERIVQEDWLYGARRCALYLYVWGGREVQDSGEAENGQSCVFCCWWIHQSTPHSLTH